MKEDKNWMQLGIVWGIAAGAVGVMALGAIGKIAYAWIPLAAGAACGAVAGLILKTKHQS